MMEGSGTLESQLEATKVRVSPHFFGIETTTFVQIANSWKKMCCSNSSSSNNTWLTIAAEVGRGARPEDPTEAY